MVPVLLAALALAPWLQETRPVVVDGGEGRRLDDYVATLERFGFAGCVHVERRGEILLRKGYGAARPDEGTPNTPETLFDIASASKQITAAAILALEAEGRLDLDDSIAKHLPGVPKEHREVTLYHLLTHTSGFPRDGPAGRGPDLETAVASYLSGKRAARAGKRFEYYNGGYALLAAVVERVTGQGFEDWVRGNLFEEAGLARTEFVETARVDPALVAASHDGRRPLATDYIRGWGYRGMGGVLTSVSDLATWCHALFGGELLQPEALEKMLTPYEESYACGWYVLETEKGRRVVQHGGSRPGFGCYVRWFPGEEALVLVACNREGFDWQVAWGLTALLLDEDPKAALPPRPAKWSEEDLAALAGTWESGAERLLLEPDDGRVVAGGLGSEVTRLLRPDSRVPAARGRAAAAPARREIEWAEERALAIVAELDEGRSDLLGAELVPGIPKTWPDMVRSRLWPAEAQRWGALVTCRSGGAFFDAASGRTRVWLVLERERGSRALEVAFVGRALNIFDLNAPPHPVTAYLVPVSRGRLRAFDFAPEPPCELLVKRGGKELELRSRQGGKLVFRRPRER